MIRALLATLMLGVAAAAVALRARGIPGTTFEIKP